MPPPLFVALIRLAASSPPRQQQEGGCRSPRGQIRQAQPMDLHRAPANAKEAGEAPKKAPRLVGRAQLRAREILPASVGFAPGSDDHRTAIASISISQPG